MTSSLSTTHEEFERTEVPATTPSAHPSAAPPSGVHDRPDAGSFTFDGSVEAGEKLAAAGKLHEAIAEYKRALLLLGSDRGQTRARLYVELGELTRRTGNARIAANNFVKALAILPLDERAYRGAFEIARELSDWRSADELLRGRAAAVSDDGERLRAWRDAALIWLERAGDPARAAQAVEQWLALAPEDVDALRRLVQVRDAQRDSLGSIDARRRLAERQDAADAAASLSDAALIARDRLRNPALALELAEAALRADPRREGLLELAEKLHATRSSWAELAALYERVLDRHPSLDVALRLAALAAERLGDRERTVLAYRRAVAVAPEDADLACTLAERELDLGAVDAARASADRARKLAPRDARSQRVSHAVAARAGDGDAAYNAAAVLDWLGEADITESVLADAHRPEGLLPVQGNLGEEDWERMDAFATCADVAAAVEALAPAAVKARLELERRRKSPPLDESARQDLESSTATLMRAAVWTARVLGIEPPAVYVVANLGRAMQPAAVEPPSLCVSRDLGSGLGLNELAFLWGRGLTAFRPRHVLGAYYPDVDALAALLVAARSVAGCKGAAAPAGDAKTLAAVLERELDRAARDALRKPLKAARDPEAAARRWLSAHERACTRAGFLASGDIAVAAGLIERFPFGSACSAEAQLDDLLVFSSSSTHGALRRRLGVAVAH